MVKTASPTTGGEEDVDQVEKGSRRPLHEGTTAEVDAEARRMRENGQGNLRGDAHRGQAAEHPPAPVSAPTEARGSRTG